MGSLGTDGAWRARYQDPLRWRSQGAATESRNSGEPRVDETESELCNLKLVMMHRPTIETWREKTGEYPFSEHLRGRRRLWELRLQLRFKQLPEKQLYFGIELGRYVPVSGITRQAQKALVSACRNIVGDCYHSPGDDPATTRGEVEPPTFVMPLWAFDQFAVSEPGSEPDLLADLEGVGVRRTDGLSAYVKALKSEINSFSTEKVYTFCFWGISQFLDCMQWEATMSGVRLDFNTLCGRPPVFFTMYESGVNEQDADRRHLPSHKMYYVRIAAWSEQRPPPAGAIEAFIQQTAKAAPNAAEQGLPDGGSKGDAILPPAAPAQVPIDLLGSFDDFVPEIQPEVAKQPPPQVETLDLLGLGD